ncbi:hypothetical protein Hdeb2414_s0028g00699431 [Helianthus debilis subsp. tardiflorus]
MLAEPLPIRDPVVVLEDGVPPLSATKDVLWRRMYEHSTRAFNFPEGILAMGGLSPFYPTRPKAFYEGIGKFFLFVVVLVGPYLLRTFGTACLADCRGVSYVVEGVVNQEMGGVLGGGSPNVEGLKVELVLGEGTPSLEGASHKGLEGSQNSPQVENVSCDDEDLET